MSNSSVRSSSLAFLLALAWTGVSPATFAAEPKLMMWERGSVEKLLAAAPAPWDKDTRFRDIVRAFAEAYPKDFAGVSFPQDKPVCILLQDGTALPYDDGREKTFEQKLDSPDLEDTFSQLYPLSNPTDHLPENFDPGRFRQEAMFFALYGASEAAVRADCVPVDFCGQKVMFSRRCGAAEALKKVSADLTALISKQPDLAIYCKNLGGTLNWRKVAGTDRLSNHSFASAIDLNVSKAAYWKWEPAAKLAKFSRLDFPQPIIEAFERHGFIWGGKWYHYDTMHFEYRPELIAFARAKNAPAPAAQR